MDYLKIPLDLSVALKGTLARCSPEESIAQNIMLLIVSPVSYTHLTLPTICSV